MVREKPLGFSWDIANTICDLVAEGQNLHVIGKLEGFPKRWEIYEWFKEQPEFYDNYARAREDRGDWRAARIDSITAQLLDGAIDPAAARVAIDAEKWQAGKEKPQTYGDRTTVQHEGGSKPIQVEARKMTDEQIQQILQIARGTSV